MMIYFYQFYYLNFCICIFQRLWKLFMTYYFLEGTHISKWTSLLYGMIRKQSTDPVFDPVSVRLSDAVHRNMNQKYVVFFLKKTLIFNGLWMFISYAVFTF